MKLVIFTSNAIRHRYVANTLASNSDECLIISECKALVSDASVDSKDPIQAHFELRDKTEEAFFADNDYFRYKTLPIIHGDVNHPYIYNIIKRFSPDLMIVYGSSIIREPLLSLLAPGKFINLHLGLSPYYRGSGTNFFPFVNRELEYIGATILHIDAGIDTGDIVTHVLPEIEVGDNVHTIGCKVIIKSVTALIQIINQIKVGEELNRVKQWRGEIDRYYRKKDFNEVTLRSYMDNLKEGVVEDFIRRKVRAARLIEM